MLSKKRSRITALIMLIFAFVFIAYAITHPTATFPWSNTVTYILYAVYLCIMILLFALSFIKRRNVQ